MRALLFSYLLAVGCGAATLSIFVSTSMARADDIRLMKATPPLNAQLAVPPECSCRAKGNNFALGAVICLDTASGPASFQCEMDQNVTSWRPVRTPCPTS